MIKKISVLLAVVLLITVAGCSSGTATSSTTTTQAAATIKQVRQAQIGGAWLLKQLEINMESSMSVMLTLNPGDKVEGFYYIVKGKGLNFQVTGESLIYESKLTDAKADFITSDRFSFTASAAQGKAYTLKLSVDNGDSKTASTAVTTVFMELIYPVTAEVWFPEGTK